MGEQHAWKGVLERLLEIWVGQSLLVNDVRPPIGDVAQDFASVLRAGPPCWPGGPLPVSEGRSGNPMSRAFVDAGVQAGLPRNDDFNGEQQDGVGMYQVTQRGGQRASAAVAYLHPAMERPNLTVMPHMLVERVLFDGSRAVGVQASRLGEPVCDRYRPRFV